MMSQKIRAMLVAISVGLLLPISQAHADETPAGELAFSIDVPQSQSQLTIQEIHNVVVMASMGRTWTVKEDRADRVVVYLNHRGSEATVTYLISDKSIQAYCEGYRTYSTMAGGVKTESRVSVQPKGWLSNLQKDITAGLQRAAYLAKK